MNFPTRFVLFFFFLVTRPVLAESADDWYQKGVASITTDKKIAYFSKAIELNSKNERVLCARAYARASKGEFNLAVADFNLAIEVVPTSRCGHKGLANIFLETERFQDAIKEFSSILESSPDEKAALQGRAAAKSALGDHAGAEEDLGRIATDAKRTANYLKSVKICTYLMLLLGGILFFAALWSLIVRRPIIISGRLPFFYSVGLFLFFFYLWWLLLGFESWGTIFASPVTWLCPLLSTIVFICVVTFTGRHIGDYVVHGISTRDFRLAIQTVLQKLGPEYEQKVLFPPFSEKADSFSMANWRLQPNKSHIFTRDREFRKNLKYVVEELKRYFCTHHVQVQGWFYFVTIFLAAFLFSWSTILSTIIDFAHK